MDLNELRRTIVGSAHLFGRVLSRYTEVVKEVQCSDNNEGDEEDVSCQIPCLHIHVCSHCMAQYANVRQTHSAYTRKGVKNE